MKVAVIQLFISLLLSQPANLCFFLWNQGGSRHKSTKQRSYWNRSTEKKTLVCCFLLTLLYLLFSSSSIRLLSSYAQLYQCCQFLYLLYHFNYILFVYWKSDFFFATRKSMIFQNRASDVCQTQCVGWRILSAVQRIMSDVMFSAWIEGKTIVVCG